MKRWSRSRRTAWAWTSLQNFYRWQGDYSRTLQNCYYLDVHANNQGSRGYAVTAEADVALTRTGGTAYDVAGLYALPAGIFYNNALRAAEGETVSVLPYYAGSDPANAEDFFLASSGSFTERCPNQKDRKESNAIEAVEKLLGEKL